MILFGEDEEGVGRAISKHEAERGCFPCPFLSSCVVLVTCVCRWRVGIWRPTCESEREEWRKEKGQKMNIKKSRTILPGIIPYTVLDLYIKWRRPTLPLCAVPSARSGLTSLFGMGRGGTLTL